MVTAELIARARAGDGDAFRELTEPYLRELQVHCYRMLGSFQDAEDALQNTLLAAWQSLGGFEGRASLRTWLYRIATHRCLDARRAASRRPAKEWDVPGVEPPEPTRLGEVVWLQPFPDALLEGAIDGPPGPEARYEQTESISLAFVTALQVLPPRQLAVLILRDVLGFHASEVAGMLDSTVESVNSALKRARASLQRRWPQAADREPPPASRSPAEDAIVAKFVSAWESADLGALVALLTDDVFIVNAADALRIRGPRRRGPLLRRPVRRGPQVRPRADASQRPAGVRGLPARPGGHPPRDRPLRAHPHRRPDLRYDPLRQQRAAVVRAAAIAPKPIASSSPGQEAVTWCGSGAISREVLVVLLGPRLAQPQGFSPSPGGAAMATMTPSAALVPVAPVFTNTERLALAGFLAGYSGLRLGGQVGAGC